MFAITVLLACAIVLIPISVTFYGVSQFGSSFLWTMIQSPSFARTPRGRSVNNHNSAKSDALYFPADIISDLVHTLRSEIDKARDQSNTGKSLQRLYELIEDLDYKYMKLFRYRIKQTRQMQDKLESFVDTLSRLREMLEDMKVGDEEKLLLIGNVNTLYGLVSSAMVDLSRVERLDMEKRRDSVQ